MAVKKSRRQTKVMGIKTVWQRSVTATLFFLSVLLPLNVNGGEPVIVELTQIPCTIVEAEENPQEFVSKSSKDCVRIRLPTKMFPMTWVFGSGVKE
jgi:hypothetical protein